MPGTTISSASVNSDFTDIATALTGSVAASGETSITGPIRFASGTALLPSITFTSEATTGVYWVSAGKLGIAGGATAIAFFDKNRVGTGQDGNQFTYANTAIPAPVGAIIDFGGSTAPAGWFLCSGANFTRASYPELFTVISTNFGSGDGLTTAGLPDLRGRVTLGRDDMGGTAANRITNAVSGITGTTLGAAGGSQSVVLLKVNLPSYNLAANTASWTYSSSTIDSSFSVSPTYDKYDPQGTQVSNTALLVNVISAASSFAATALTSNGTISTTVSSFAGAIGGTIASGGSDLAHVNVPPAMIVNKIIFAGRP